MSMLIDLSSEDEGATPVSVPDSLPHMDKIALSAECLNLNTDMFFSKTLFQQSELDYLKQTWSLSMQYLDSFEDEGTDTTNNVYYKSATAMYKMKVKKRKQSQANC